MRRQARSLVRSALRASEATSASNSTTAAASFAIRRGYADDANLLKTPLYDFHVENGGMSLAHPNAFAFINFLTNFTPRHYSIPNPHFIYAIDYHSSSILIP